MSWFEPKEFTGFLFGAIFFGFLILGVLFLRFWKRSRDRFFLMFSIAFFLMAVERLFMLSVRPITAEHAMIFLIRLTSYLCIIAAILDKNLKKADD